MRSRKTVATLRGFAGADEDKEYLDDVATRICVELGQSAEIDPKKGTITLTEIYAENFEASTRRLRSKGRFEVTTTETSDHRA